MMGKIWENSMGAIRFLVKHGETTGTAVFNCMNCRQSCMKFQADHM